jgi:hypothetical protein
MAEHAVLAPSAAERWIQCPASVRVEADHYPSGGGESSYAQEGTKAHALGELMASLHFGRIESFEYSTRYEAWRKMAPGLSPEDESDMYNHIVGYVALLEEHAALHPNTQVLLEQRVLTGIDSCWGTADAVLVSPVHVEIVDLKYGQGVPVFAPGNPQLRLYGVGALELFGTLLGDVETVRCTVHQPRLNSTSTEELTAAELRAWRDSLIPIAEEALAPGAHFGPSETACRWCPAAGECRARVEFMTAQDFAVEPDLLDGDELAELLPRLASIREWCDAVANSALDRAYSRGEHIPGYKVVRSGGQRYVTDPDKAAERLAELGMDEDAVWSRKLKGIGDLEKLVKAHGEYKKLEDALGELVGRTPGKPALAPEDDNRPAIDPDGEAVKEFSE